MVRRLLPTLILFGLGFAALTWGLASLQSIFTRERDEARAGVRARRNALEQYAHQALAEDLGRELAGARPAIEKALADPLAPDDRLLMVEHGEQLLPRPVTFAAGTSTPAKTLYQQLRKPAGTVASAEPDSPWAERLKLRRRFVRAVQAGDTSDVENVFRDLLYHRARYVIAATRDLPYMVALLDYFSAASTPSPRLLRMLLRDGFPHGRGQRMTGLQRDLLAHRARFTRADFAFLAARVLAQCQSHGVAHDDFRERSRARPRKPLALPAGLSGQALVLGGRYFVRPEGQVVRGARVHLARMLGRITARMKHLRLLGEKDRVTAAPLPAGAAPVESVALAVRSPIWARLRGDLEQRYRLKTMLTVACGLLALIIVIGALVFQHRKHRYLQLKSDFVASVSHELRTPLASIRLLAETLERRTAGQPEVREYPARIVRDVDGLSFLVENILSFNRLDKGRWQIRPRRVRLDEVVADLAEDLPTVTACEVQVETDGLAEADLHADPELVRLLLSNLGRNGCLYNERDPVRLRFAAKPVDGRRVVSVTDNGVGIEAGERDKVFGEFYRPADPTGRGVRGSGLGLAMCRRIMKLHGGTIRVAESGPEGTTFELRFPERS